MVRMCFIFGVSEDGSFTACQHTEELSQGTR